MTGVGRGVVEMSLGCWQSSLLNHRCSSVIIHKVVHLFFVLFHMCFIVKMFFKKQKKFCTSIRMRTLNVCLVRARVYYI